ncbi:iron-sulfur cluster assembly protein [Mangrovicoccus ximenensis]|uniref:iron-sulfur cluster assembly protein n=1 Tax=Mangrovicoccus ximenensis TaxID=1911570 RepID=UPI001F1B1A50|nr:iron-sulfur cluster assembly protein [Mangrovicoccus ximenensis]
MRGSDQRAPGRDGRTSEQEQSLPASRETVQAVLKSIADPVQGGDIMSSGVVRALNVDGQGAVRFVMEIPPSQAAAYGAAKAEAEAALKAAEGVSAVSIVMTGHADKAPPDLPVRTRRRRTRRRGRTGQGAAGQRPLPAHGPPRCLRAAVHRARTDGAEKARPSTSSDTCRSAPPAAPCCPTFSSRALRAHQRRHHGQPQHQRMGVRRRARTVASARSDRWQPPSLARCPAMEGWQPRSSAVSPAAASDARTGGAFAGNAPDHSWMAPARQGLFAAIWHPAGCGHLFGVCLQHGGCAPR